MHKIEINITNKNISSTIFISNNLLINKKISDLIKPNICIITNKTIAPIYIDKIINIFNNNNNNNNNITKIILPDGEEHKNLEQLSYIWNELLKNKIPPSSTTIISLGGGVITDITGFAASTYLRGVDVIHIPTTLLAQIDASIGGKTAINHHLGKNMIGTFYQPKTIILDAIFLNTLPILDFNSAMSEAIKYGLIWDKKFFNWLIDNNKKIKNKDHKTLTHLIKTCAEIKANIIMQDPLEQKGLRALLNLGHTFAHAIENLAGYGEYTHGEAVSIGTILALEYSINKFPENSLELKLILQNTIEFLDFFDLPINLNKLSNKYKNQNQLDNLIKNIIKNMSRDKKNISTDENNIQLILVNKAGSALQETGDNKQIKSILNNYL